MKELLEAKRYMQVRASRHIVFDFPDEGEQDYFVDINPNLFSWVLENLLSNAWMPWKGRQDHGQDFQTSPYDSSGDYGYRQGNSCRKI
ncbi:MAG: hypothetical protein IPG21_11145 [Saprospiraceae bacterium]|nr:hypothetical protein [Candidatus Vicinibacter affinis]